MATTRAADRKLLFRGMSQVGARYESQWLDQRRLAYTSSEFQVNGFFILPISDETAANLSAFFEEGIARLYSNDDVASGFERVDLPPSVAAKYNDFNVFYGPPEREAQVLLEQWLKQVSGTIESQLCHGWKIANIRAWTTKPSAEFGGSAWHFDMFSNYLRKIMIYPHVLTAENGSVELYDRQGRRHLLETQTPCGVLFDNSILLHRGRSSQAKPRPAIEVTIVPSAETEVSFLFGGQAALCPDDLPADSLSELINERYQPPEYRPSLGYRVARSVYRALKRAYRPVAESLFDAQSRGARAQQAQTVQTYANFARTDAGTVHNLMMGLVLRGGPQFSAPGWVNLDETAGEANEFPFRFDAHCVFPIASSSIQTAYVPRGLTDVRDDVVGRVLRECLRVLSPEGLFVIHAPHQDADLAGRLSAAGFEVLTVEPSVVLEKLATIPQIADRFDVRRHIVARRPARFRQTREVDAN